MLMLSWLRDRISASRLRVLEVCRSRGIDRRAENFDKGAGDGIHITRSCRKSSSFTMTETDANTPVHITLISPLGQHWKTRVSTMMTTDNLRTLALTQFNIDPSLTYRMLLVRNRRNLLDTRTLTDDGVVNNDEILMVVSRSEPPKVLEDEALRGPQEADIIQATAHIPPSKHGTVKAANIEEMVATSELQLEMRKILISLAEHSARVLSASPMAPAITKMLRQRLSSARPTDPIALQGLIDMGFSNAVATRALRMHYGDANLALETLLGDSTFAGNVDDEEAERKEELNFEAKTPSEYCNLLVSLVRAHANRDFQAHPGHLQELQTMGFSELEARQALRATGNNHPAACEWLLGVRSRSLSELREGLASDSPVLQALLESPQVQLSLANPKMLLAYLSMLDSHAALNMWLNDPEASPVLSHILRTYHAEKHALAVNQFSGSP